MIPSSEVTSIKENKEEQKLKNKGKNNDKFIPNYETS